MEIDFSTTGSPATSSRHASPFHHHHHHSTTMMSTANATDVPVNNPGPSGSARKRQRSNNSPSSYYEDVVQGSYSSRNFVQDASEDEDVPRTRTKRRTLKSPMRGDVEVNSHFYRALGSGIADLDPETGEAMIGVGNEEGVGSMYEASEYGVDSPMNLLRLISRSPSLDDTLQSDLNEGDRRQAFSEDTEMTGGLDESSASSFTIERLIDLKQSSPSHFVPRQLRQTQLRTTNAPVRPSPLAQQADDFGSTGSSDSSPRPKMMERSNSNTSQESTFSLRRSLTQSSIQRSTTEVNINRRMSQDDQGNLPLRRSSMRFDRLVRTPSPMPLMTSIEIENHQDNENQSGSSKNSNEGGTMWSLHPSPGMNSSQFPGGKQMLRYTMGYRDDCEQCQNKVPGHYGHVVHRAN